jgi:hypothetical protein
MNIQSEQLLPNGVLIITVSPKCSQPSVLPTPAYLSLSLYFYLTLCYTLLLFLLTLSLECVVDLHGDVSELGDGVHVAGLLLHDEDDVGGVVSGVGGQLLALSVRVVAGLVALHWKKRDTDINA